MYNPTGGAKLGHRSASIITLTSGKILDIVYEFAYDGPFVCTYLSRFMFYNVCVSVFEVLFNCL